MSLTLVSILSRIACARTEDRLVKLHIQPTVVILSMRVDETVEQYFDPDGRSRGATNGGDGKDVHYNVMFRLTSAR